MNLREGSIHADNLLKYKQNGNVKVFKKYMQKRANIDYLKQLTKNRDHFQA